MRKGLYYLSGVLCFCILTSCGSNDSKTESDTKDSNLVYYPEKEGLLLQTDRPPQLETPLRVFRMDITPNKHFFVRRHLSKILTDLDIDTFHLYIGGAVDKPLALSMNDLKTKFPADSVIALEICSGNSRSTFDPKVPGTQWKNGAMGNAKWKGVKLKYILEMAGVKKGAVDVSFHGMDKGQFDSIPAFVKSLDVKHALDGEVLVAYEMNGEDMPMLNGYPLKLVVPGWYATYWVGNMNQINVLTEKFQGYWMTGAYKIANDSTANESPENLSKNSVPINRVKLHSIFVQPEPGEKVVAGKPCHVEGLAFNDGTGIKKVELSFDDGATWTEAAMNPEIAKYSWRRWKYNWTPSKPGTYRLCVKATDTKGGTQPGKQWNRSGYARSFIETLEVQVN